MTSFTLYAIASLLSIIAPVDKDTSNTAILTFHLEKEHFTVTNKKSANEDLGKKTKDATNIAAAEIEAQDQSNLQFFIDAQSPLMQLIYLFRPIARKRRSLNLHFVRLKKLTNPSTIIPNRATP